MIKTVTLTGTETKAEGLGGFNTVVHNLGADTIYASKYPDVAEGADNVAEIPAGAAKLISTTNGTVYLLGTGRAELTGQDHDNVNFRQPSSSGGGDGLGEFLKSYVDECNGENLKAAKAYADEQDGKVFLEAERYAERAAEHYAKNTAIDVKNELWQTIVDVSKSSAKEVKDELMPMVSDKMDKTDPSGTGTFSLNRMEGTAIGEYSCAEGTETTCSGNSGHAEGYKTVVTEEGKGAHAEGFFSVAANIGAHAQGKYCKAMGEGSFATGHCVFANGFGETALGRFNKSKSDNVFSIGWGTARKEIYDIEDVHGYSLSAPDYYQTLAGLRMGVDLANIFRIDTGGIVYTTAAIMDSGADYAEYIKPWYDDNAENEDRRGYFVTIRDGKLYKAEPGDYIVGITSGNPSVIGNGDEDWLGRWQRDEFNSLVFEDVEISDYEARVDADGSVIRVKTGSHIEKQRVENPDYDDTLDYVGRKDRPEWSCVGMIGVLPLRDDGTCTAGGFAKCGSGGVATAADEWECHKTFFVIERINDHIVSVEMR